MSWRRKHPAPAPVPAPAPQHMRVLRDPAELEQAAERAAEGERRLRARLEARAARDAWTAERRDGGTRTVRTLRILGNLPGGTLPPPLGGTPAAGPPSSHRSPAA